MWAWATVETKALVLALSFGNDFICLGDIFFEGDGVAKLTFAFALEFLKSREIGLRGGEMSLGGGELDGGVLARF